MTLLHALQKVLSIVYYAGFDHFSEKVVSLAGTLSHTGKDRESVMLLGDIVYKFLDKDCLSYTGTSEKSDLTSLEIRFKKVNDLDSREEHLLRSSKVLEFRRLAMDRECSFPIEFIHSVDCIAGDIHHSASDLRTDRHGYRSARTFYGKSSFKSIC